MDNDRQRRLEEALKVAERVGNTFMASNIRQALKELLGTSEKNNKNL